MSIGAVGGGSSMLSSLMMKALDQDKSGTASLEEFTPLGQSLETTSADKSEDALARAFASLDSDEDGSLTEGEIAQGLAKFSSESAGALLGAQEAARPPPPGGAGGPGGGFFAEADADDSGSISLDEFYGGRAEVGLVGRRRKLVLRNRL
ncbi:EF-hand domain-containing protein [Chenggangzhangella methanolivorans]|uniref:EF-hand domain-containing protein n=1 Tax=Chenggangzhangella methanolivorans TaxID=1437009 RepID=A0A9E6RAU1_9HYPH|nr:EF-hand domain-containing protein [Chenggangzhangella methanolivorans]QZO00955.1 EF-hand domain-containing protein [Chenggangzhangella methanolivorans]